MIRPSRSASSLPFVVTISIALMAPCAAQGQYMYLDTNGDGVHTDADTIHPSGPTSIDVWIRTDANRDGSPTSCVSGEQLSISTYEFILHAADGTVAWGTFTNLQAPILPCGYSRSDSTDFYVGYCGVPGSPPGAPPGLYHLGNISVSVTGGTPSILLEASTHLLSVAITSFGSACSGIDGDNTIKLGTDWFDTDGARYGGWVNPPILAQPANMTAAEGSVVDQEIAASDPDGSMLGMSKESGPGYMTVQNLGTTQSGATGLIRLTPGYSDSGHAIGEVRVSDGIASDYRSFGIDVLNVNRPPQLDFIPDLCVEQGQNLIVPLHAFDPDRDPVHISGAGLPPNVELNDTGYGYAHLSVTAPPSGGADSSSFSIFASDGAAADSQIVHLRSGAIGFCSGRGPLQTLVYPNPTPGNATLSFWTSKPGRLRVTLHDLRGRRVRTLLDMGDAPSANYRLPIDVGYPGADRYLSSGVYFYRIEGADGVTTGRFMLIRKHSSLDE